MTRSVACAVLLTAVLGVACGDDDAPVIETPPSVPNREVTPVGNNVVAFDFVYKEVTYVCFSRTHGIRAELSCVVDPSRNPR